jgi:quercetin dioxygenase-like cupin family protein
MGTSVPLSVVIRRAGEGERRWFAGGGTFTMKALPEETNGSLVLFEDELVRGKVTPLHLHATFEETMYVLDGELLVHVDGEEYPVGAGGVVLFPRGGAHAFMCISETARILAIQTPALFSFYLDASDAITSLDQEDRPPDFDRLRAAAERSNDIEILGPPPFAPLTGENPVAASTTSRRSG